MYLDPSAETLSEIICQRRGPRVTGAGKSRQALRPQQARFVLRTAPVHTAWIWAGPESSAAVVGSENCPCSNTWIPSLRPGATRSGPRHPSALEGNPGSLCFGASAFLALSTRAAVKSDSSLGSAKHRKASSRRSDARRPKPRQGRAGQGCTPAAGSENSPLPSHFPWMPAACGDRRPGATLPSPAWPLFRCPSCCAHSNLSLSLEDIVLVLGPPSLCMASSELGATAKAKVTVTGSGVKLSTRPSRDTVQPMTCPVIHSMKEIHAGHPTCLAGM